MEKIKMADAMAKTGKITISAMQEVRGRETGTELYKVETLENPGTYSLVERNDLFRQMFADLKNGRIVTLEVDETNSQPKSFTRNLI